MGYRTALVTGASSGIGRSLALEMARAGVEVALCARRAEALAEVAELIRAEHGVARVYPLDVTDVETTREVIGRADEEMGGLELIVAGAGVGTRKWHGKVTWEDCAPILATNVTGVVATITSILPSMVLRRHGQIAAISSLAGYRGLPKFATYSASKAFVSTFLEGLRIDLKTTGVGVSDIRPGFVRTPLLGEAKMPLTMEADEAARIIWGGLSRRQAIIEFPWQLVVALRGSRMVPQALYEAVAGKMK